MKTCMDSVAPAIHVGAGPLALLRRLLLVVMLAAAPVLPAHAEDFVLVHERGQLERLDFGNNTAMIGGLRFRFAVDARVEIAGSFGAFTMLREGMKVEYVYKRYSDSDREVVVMRQLPDSTNLPLH